MKRIKVVGLTGGIGTGKSTAAAYLKTKGFAHIDADEIGKAITADGSPMLKILDAIFGPDGEMGEKEISVLNENGSLDRKALAGLVFSNKDRKACLDKIMFREICGLIDRQIDDIRENDDDIPAGILLDAPLLYEAGLETRCDMVMVLVADRDIRIERVCARDNAAPQEVVARIENQLDDKQKIKKADVVIDNSEDEAALYEKLDWFLEDFYEKAQAK